VLREGKRWEGGGGEGDSVEGAEAEEGAVRVYG
jgi:hypothetical protein